MTDKTCKICGYDDVIEGKDICKFCENAQAAISDVEMRKSVSVDLHKFSSLFSKEGDYVEVTEWTNGEGFDICLCTSETNHRGKTLSLTRDEIEAIYNALVLLGMEFIVYKKVNTDR